jgi:hypothetical protein
MVGSLLAREGAGIAFDGQEDRNRPPPVDVLASTRMWICLEPRLHLCSAVQGIGYLSASVVRPMLGLGADFARMGEHHRALLGDMTRPALLL